MLMSKITIAKGDGIGPEIMEATIRLLNAAGARLEMEEVHIGEKVYLSGNTSGISNEDWEKIRKNKIFLKAPMTTPQGGGYKSLNVTLRKTLGLFANVRPCKSFAPYITTKHPEMDLTIIRENEEDLYAGIEHQQTDEVVQCLKLISRPGCEKIIRYAFEYAKVNGRKKVTCFSKDNIMKLTDGLFHKVFDEIRAGYPDIESDHYIVDIGTALIADRPEKFDVVVMPNLYGDIVSDITGQISGSVGLAGSSNIGETHAMFEAIHGSAPDIAGKNIANPTGLMQGAVLMLQHIGQAEVGEKILNAIYYTIESGIHTADIYNPNNSVKKVGTKEFTDEVINNLGKIPSTLQPANLPKDTSISIPTYQRPAEKNRELIGIDVFLYNRLLKPNDLGERLARANTEFLQLQMITNRGIKVFPNGFEETFCTDHWRCRFVSDEKQKLNQESLIELLQLVSSNNFEIIKTENLYKIDGNYAFSLGQGQ